MGIGEEQYFYEPKTVCKQHIQIKTTDTHEKRKKITKHVCFFFVDLETAYDTVPQTKLSDAQDSCLRTQKTCFWFWFGHMRRTEDTKWPKTAWKWVGMNVENTVVLPKVGTQMFEKLCRVEND